MRKLSGRERIVLLLCGILAAIFVLKTLSARFAAGQASYSDQMKIKEQQLTKYRQKIADHHDISRKWEQYHSIFRQEGTEDEVESIFLSQLDSLARQARLNILDIKPSRARKEDFYASVSIYFFAEGEFLPIMSFLHAAQNPPYLFTIEDLTLERNPRPEGLMKCRITLSRIVIP